MPRSPSDIFSVVEISQPVISKSRLEMKLVTGLSAVVIDAEPGIAYAAAKGVPSHSPAAPRNTDLDIYFNCEGYDINGNARQGVGISLAVAYGSIPFIDFVATATSVAYAYGSSNWGLVYDGTATALAKAYGELLLEGIKRNWVKWSNIGSLDFTIWKDNIAGEHPLDWKGWVYAIKKLRDKIVVYGENGVSLLTPVGPAYGLNTIYRIGLKGKHAVTGDDTKHFFIDRDGKLIKLTDSIDILDYSEYLSTLYSSIVMSYDALNNLVYICDGDKGYVFDVSGNSLGECQGNITGVGYQSGTLYITAPAAIITDPFEICTDIYDFGTRNGKTIHSLEFGTDLTTGLYASIDYRRDKATGFSQTPWYTVWKNGMVPINAYGREFRFRVKTLIYEQFNLDYILINGVQDAY